MPNIYLLLLYLTVITIDIDNQEMNKYCRFRCRKGDENGDSCETFNGLLRIRQSDLETVR